MLVLKLWATITSLGNMILYRIPLKGSEAIGSHLKVKAADLRKTNSLEGWGTQTFHCWDYKPQRPHLPVHTLHALAGGSAQGSSQNSAMKCVACMRKVLQDHTFTRNCCILLKPHGVILFPSLTHATGSEQLWCLLSSAHYFLSGKEFSVFRASILGPTLQ